MADKKPIEDITKRIPSEKETETKPVVVSVYHVVDKTGKHQFLTINDYAMHQLGGASGFEKELAAQFQSYELLGTAQVSFSGEAAVEIRESNPGHIRRRIEQICTKYPGTAASVMPWLPEDRSDPC